MVFILIQILIEQSVRKKRDTDQMPRSVTFDLSLHCLPMSHKKMLGLYGSKRSFIEKNKLCTQNHFIVTTKRGFQQTIKKRQFCIKTKAMPA